jgi:hypothetical protein
MNLVTFFARVEAAQRLQGCGRVCGRRLAPHPKRDAGFSILRDSRLGNPPRCAAYGKRISGRAHSCVGL